LDVSAVPHRQGNLQLLVPYTKNLQGKMLNGAANDDKFSVTRL
jgi:hypothetical protein